MPPPMSSRSAVCSRLSITPSLSETLAPPSTTAYGRSGLSVSRLSTLDLGLARDRRRRPAAAGRRRRPTPACGARRRTRRRRTTSASPASWRANSARSSSSLAVSPGLNRRFSSSTTSPSCAASTAAWALSPTVSVAKVTSRPSSSPSRAATGASEYFASGAPLGRPRWAHTTTRAPASDRALIVGTEARIRPSSVIVLPSRGTLRSDRTRTRLPRRSPSSEIDFIGVAAVRATGRRG